jgi:hypothetical protein
MIQILILNKMAVNMMKGGFKPNLKKNLNGYLFVLLPIHVKHIINIYKIKDVLLKLLKLMK